MNNSDELELFILNSGSLYAGWQEIAMRLVNKEPMKEIRHMITAWVYEGVKSYYREVKNSERRFSYLDQQEVVNSIEESLVYQLNNGELNYLLN